MHCADADDAHAVELPPMQDIVIRHLFYDKPSRRTGGGNTMEIETVLLGEAPTKQAKLHESAAQRTY